MTPQMVVLGAVVVLVLALGTYVARIALHHRRRMHYLREVIVGRQQLRAEARRLSQRAVGGTPISRKVRRAAAREIASKVT